MKRVLLSTLCLVFALIPLSERAFAYSSTAPFTWVGSGLSTAVASDPSTFTTLPASTSPGSTRVNVSQWNRHNLSATATTAAACYNSNNWDLGTTLAGAQASGKYIYFTITNDNTTELTVDSVTLFAQVSATGPIAVQMQYDLGAGDQNFGASATGYATGSAVSFKFIGTVHLCASQSVTFKLYGWGGSSAAGTLRILDNSQVGARWTNALAVNPTVTTPVCVGGIVNFTGTTVSIGTALTGWGLSAFSRSYSWTGPGPGFPSSFPNPFIFGVAASAAGTYTYTETDSIGCTASGTATLVVNAAPATPTITPSGTVTICSFDSVVFTAPAGYTYQWDTLRPGGGPPTYVAIPGATNATYSAKRANRYRVVVYNATGCNTPSASTIVNVNPAASGNVTASGSLSFCTGGSVTLTSTATGAAYTWQWFDGTTPITGATTNAYTATTSGNYNVQITSVANGCVTKSATFIVVEVSIPTISTADTTSFCAGGHAMMAVNISAGATGVQYQWQINTVNIPGATGSTYAASATGDYTCHVTIPGSCSIVTNDILINVNPLPTPSISFNPANNKLSTYNYYTRYQWYLNTVTIPGATTKSVTAYNNGSYRVMVTDTFGCSVLSGPYGLYNLAVQNVSNNADVKIYPNPATNVLHIEANIDTKVVISSIEGKIVITDINNKEINITSLPDGLYFVSVYDTDGNRVKVEKLVKQ